MNHFCFQRKYDHTIVVIRAKLTLRHSIYFHIFFSDSDDLFHAKKVHDNSISSYRVAVVSCQVSIQDDSVIFDFCVSSTFCGRVREAQTKQKKVA